MIELLKAKQPRLDYMGSQKPQHNNWANCLIEKTKLKKIYICFGIRVPHQVESGQLIR